MTSRTVERPTYGPAVGKIARLLGLEPLPHQQLIWDVLLEVQSEAAGDPLPGRWAYSTGDITAPRRAGKTVTLQPLTMHRAEMLQRGSIAMTAQTGKAAARRWRDLANVIEDSYMADRVRLRDSPGHWRVLWLATRSVFEPFAPKEDANHGDEHDLVLATEIWKWTAEQGAAVDLAVRPMMLTNDVQFIRESTAGTVESAYYNAARRSGRQAVLDGVNLGRFYIEYSVPEKVEVGGKLLPVESLADDLLVDVVAAYHPRQDIPNLRQFLADELEAALSPVGSGRLGFLRSYGNYVPEQSERPGLLDAKTLAYGLTTRQIPEGSDIPVGLAFDLDPEMRQGTISAVWRDPDTGVALSEVIRCEPGVRWLPEAIVGICERQINAIPQVAANDTAVTRDVADQLKAAGITVLLVGLKDYAAAYSRWRNSAAAVDEEQRPAPEFLHQGSPHYLDAIKHAGTRLVQGMSLPAVIDEPITALTAPVLALWAFDHLPEAEPDIGPFRIY